MQDEVERLKYLDSIRGFAAMAVVLFHYRHLALGCQPTGVNPGLCPFHYVEPFVYLYDYGVLGVDLFFVLSGVVFSYVYLERVRDRSITALEFARRRFARLYPIHLATLLFVAPLIWGFHHYAGRFPLLENDPNDLHEFLLNLCFVQGGIFHAVSGFNTPSWSLSVEEMMYALFFAAARLRLSSLLPLAMIAAGWWMLVSPNQWHAAFVNFPVGRGLFGFGLGMLVYRWRGWWWALALPLYAGFKYCDWLGQVPQFDLLFALTILLVLAVRPLQWALRFRPLVKLGDISLTIYMLHIPVQMVLIVAWWNQPIPTDRTWFLLFYLVAVVGGAYVVDKFYVAPARAWIRGWGTRREWTRVAAVSERTPAPAVRANSYAPRCP